ncbi:hypothetical protein COO60DRAFT_943512 [Scenedesmus sp. NREL 46B-D3]|nr:hypothetical protein COO60DRAFT_943512 [Scenedesmus sp. NREL 46B-D3]
MLAVLELRWAAAMCACRAPAVLVAVRNAHTACDAIRVEQRCSGMQACNARGGMGTRLGPCACFALAPDSLLHPSCLHGVCSAMVRMACTGSQVFGALGHLWDVCCVLTCTNGRLPTLWSAVAVLLHHCCCLLPWHQGQGKRNADCVQLKVQ